MELKEKPTHFYSIFFAEKLLVEILKNLPISGIEVHRVR